MNIKFVNHASVLFQTSNVKILTDPWYQGLVFNNGWSLLDDNEININDLDFNYLWYSHEHPDHFNIPDLLAIDEKKRRDITILFQQTKDQKVKKYCESKGFSVKELKDCEAVDLGGVEVICGQCGHDSWLSVRHGGVTALNLNDCRVETPQEIHEVKSVVGNVDILLTQFGSANWTGNENDLKTKNRAKEKVFYRTDNQIKHIKPNRIIPFASFCYFCHEENQFCNDQTATITEFTNRYPEENVWVPFYGEQMPHTKCENDQNLKKWETLYDKKTVKSFSQSTDVEILREQYRQMKNDLSNNNDMALFDMIELEPCVIFLTDLEKIATLDLSLEELQICNGKQERADISMTSESLLFVLRHKWGRGTLMVNGRFQSGKDIKKFFRQTQLYYMNNIGRYYPSDICEKDILNTNSFVFELLDASDS